MMSVTGIVAVNSKFPLASLVVPVVPFFTRIEAAASGSLVSLLRTIPDSLDWPAQKCGNMKNKENTSKASFVMNQFYMLYYPGRIKNKRSIPV
jgi:hypothetical protein